VALGWDDGWKFRSPQEKRIPGYRAVYLTTNKCIYKTSTKPTADIQYSKAQLFIK